MNKAAKSCDESETVFLERPDRGGNYLEKVSTRQCMIAELLDNVDENKKIQCGLGNFKPKWIQRFACKEVLILLYSLAAIVQGMYFSYTVAVMSTIEKRFKLTSFQTGIVLAGNDIAAVIFAPFLGYYLNSRHRPRWLGMGIILTAISSFITALPHFIYGPGEDIGEILSLNHTISPMEHHGSGKASLCPATVEDLCLSSSIDKETEVYLGALIFIFVAQFIVGISMSAYFCIGISYVDDNVTKKTTSIYYSIHLLLRTLGPILGFLVGGKCLEYWIVPGQAITGLSPKDPKWLGAWWLGFLLIGSVLVLIGICFSLLPFKLPETFEREKQKLLRIVEKSDGFRSINDVKFPLDTFNSPETTTKPTLKNMLRVTKKLFSNKIYVANLYNTSVYVLGIFGYKIFKPKFVEHQFRKSASEANYYIGTVILIATSLGTIISALVLRFIRPGPRIVTGYNIFVTLFICLMFIMKIMVKCSQLEVIGMPSDENTGILECSSTCGCNKEFSPTCSEDNTTLFYSPCYAGCTTVDASVNPLVYNNCSCIINGSFTFGLSEINFSKQSSTATKGYCPESCDTFIYYVLLEIMTITAFATGKIGSTIIYLRAVDDKDKGLSIGITEVFLALFGCIPGPIIMGKIIDFSCIVWEDNCGVQGNCWLYDTDKFRILLHSVVAGFILLSVLGDIVMFKYAHLLDLYGDKEFEVPGGSEVDELPFDVDSKSEKLTKSGKLTQSTD